MDQTEQVVLGTAARALVVADRYLGHALGERVGQRRNEGRLLVACNHGVDDVAAVGAQHASIVVHRHAHDHRGHPVLQIRGEAAIGEVVALLAPSADHVVARIDRGEQARNFLGRILQVGVERHHDLAAALAKAGQDGGVLAEVARQFDHAHRAMRARGDLAQDVERLIGRAVVDEQELPTAARTRASPAPAGPTARADWPPRCRPGPPPTRAICPPPFGARESRLSFRLSSNFSVSDAVRAGPVQNDRRPRRAQLLQTIPRS